MCAAFYLLDQTGRKVGSNFENQELSIILNIRAVLRTSGGYIYICLIIGVYKMKSQMVYLLPPSNRVLPLCEASLDQIYWLNSVVFGPCNRSIMRRMQKNPVLSLEFLLSDERSQNAGNDSIFLWLTTIIGYYSSVRHHYTVCFVRYIFCRAVITFRRSDFCILFL